VQVSDRAETIRAIIESFRPSLQRDGGDIELLEVVGNSARVRLHGSCVGCPASAATLRMGIEQLIRDALPDFGELIEVPDDAIEPATATDRAGRGAPRPA
jgi:Fe-S cluster biogenesis protein NfuA